MANSANIREFLATKSARIKLSMSLLVLAAVVIPLAFAEDQLSLLETVTSLLNDKAKVASIESKALRDEVFTQGPSLSATMLSGKSAALASTDLDKRVIDKTKAQLMAASTQSSSDAGGAFVREFATDAIPYQFLNAASAVSDFDLEKENAILNKMLSLVTVGFGAKRPPVGSIILPGSSREFVQALINDARATVAQHALNTIIATHEAPQKDAKSLISTMQYESIGRLAGSKSDWLAKLSSSPKEAIARELNQIKAARLYLKYLQYRQNERIESLLATKLVLDSDLKKVYDEMERTAKAGSGG